MFISIRDVRYAVDVVESVNGQKDTLLLLHGFTGCRQVFDSFVDEWSKQYRLVIPDLLGHGESDVPTDPRRYAMQETTADLKAIMDYFDLSQVDLLGYSMGGRIALGFAITYPTCVRRLVLEGASPGLQMEEDRRQRIELDEVLARFILEEGIRAFVDRWESLPLFASQERLPSAVLGRQREIRLSHRAVGLASSLQGIGTGRQPSYWLDLADFESPTLLVTGGLDPKFTDLNRHMQEQFQNAEHVVLADAGHTPHLEKPSLFSQQVLSFLNGNCALGEGK